MMTGVRRVMCLCIVVASLGLQFCSAETSWRTNAYYYTAEKITVICESLREVKALYESGRVADQVALLGDKEYWVRYKAEADLSETTNLRKICPAFASYSSRSAWTTVTIQATSTLGWVTQNLEMVVTKCGHVNVHVGSCPRDPLLTSAEVESKARGYDERTMGLYLARIAVGALCHDQNATAVDVLDGLLDHAELEVQSCALSHLLEEVKPDLEPEGGVGLWPNKADKDVVDSKKAAWREWWRLNRATFRPTSKCHS